jgi:DeoR/GlpR family transcriptional regulator of sugar metabolism
MSSRILLPDRWSQIIDLVDRRGGASVDEISKALEISPATTRRDLARIQARGLLRRTRGGAEPSSHLRIGRTIAESRRTNPLEKERIGRAAAALVHPGETLMIDGGFTTYQVARHLPPGPLNVVTNSFDVAQVLAARHDVTLTLIGGTLNAMTGTTIGPTTETQIQHLGADKVILGTDALSPAEGISSPHPDTAQTKRAMVQRSRRVIVVADFSKLGPLALYRVAPIQSVSTLVTDDKADPAMTQSFRAAEVEVIIAQ